MRPHLEWTLSLNSNIYMLFIKTKLFLCHWFPGHKLMATIVKYIIWECYIFSELLLKYLAVNIAIIYFLKICFAMKQLRWVRFSQCRFTQPRCVFYTISWISSLVQKCYSHVKSRLQEEKPSITTLFKFYFYFLPSHTTSSTTYKCHAKLRSNRQRSTVLISKRTPKLLEKCMSTRWVKNKECYYLIVTDIIETSWTTMKLNKL